MIRLASVATFVFRYPIDTPVRTAFGTMHNRPMALVRVRDDEGLAGYGEIWCNFPAGTAEYRAQLVDHVLAALILDRDFADARALYRHLNAHLHVLSLQSGEPGPFSSCIAAIDMAVHDLLARKANLPLCAYLGGNMPDVPIYASGINPGAPEETVDRLRAQGYKKFKLKVGFDAALDLRNIRAIHRGLAAGEALAIDANQGWTCKEALAMFDQIKDLRLAFIEEPLCADRPLSEWQTLRHHSAHPLAAGENIQGQDGFAQAISCGAIDIFQPDIAKWGGFSGCLSVAKAVMGAGHRYFPHYLGGGIGLLASGHLLAVAGGDGWLEVDCNPNPLRSELLGGVLDNPARGMVFNDLPGLGFTPDLAALGKYQTHSTM